MTTVTAPVEAEAREADCEETDTCAMAPDAAQCRALTEAEWIGQKVLAVKREIDDRRQLVIALERRHLAIEEEKRAVNRELRGLWEAMRDLVGLD